MKKYLQTILTTTPDIILNPEIVIQMTLMVQIITILISKIKGLIKMITIIPEISTTISETTTIQMTMTMIDGLQQWADNKITIWTGSQMLWTFPEEEVQAIEDYLIITDLEIECQIPKNSK